MRENLLGDSPHFTLDRAQRYSVHWLFRPNKLMSNITVLLVDDHTIVRQGLRALLLSEGDISIVAEAQTGREAVELVSQHNPRIVIMDLAMPRLNGAEAT